MNTADALNQIVAYIEENLTGEISMEQMARIAQTSQYDIQRTFSAVAGVPVGEYIRRRRLTLAARDLAQGARVIDLAAEYGYASPDAFSRAFLSHHGQSPTAVRAGGNSIQAYPRLTFSIVVRGDAGLAYRIAHLPAFRFVGRSFPITINMEEGNAHMTRAAAAWNQLNSADYSTLIPLSNVGPSGLVGMSHGYEGMNYHYVISVATTRVAPEGYDELEVPAGEWVVFEAEGMLISALAGLRDRIYNEWLPGSGYVFVDDMDFEWYEKKDLTDPGNHMEIWFPIARNDSSVKQQEG